jgi:pimeloyl-ACP methyl ester carboxylesterase
LFGNLFPNHNAAINIDKIKVPVILLAGRYDYDCLPLNLWRSYSKPKNFTMIDCGDAGHWPNIESSEVFDSAIEQWLQKHFISYVKDVLK